MRVTNSMVLTSTLNDLNRSLARLQDSQTDLTTGRTVRKVSDDPTRASAAMSIRNQLRRADHHERSLGNAEAWLSAADTALVSGLETLGSVKEATVRASNGGALDANSREAIANSIDGMRDDLLALSNTKYLGRSIFNGTAAGDAYDGTGAYLGNDAVVRSEVAQHTTIETNVTGEEVFGAESGPDGNVFDVLDRLAAAVRSGDDAAIAAAHTDLDTATDRWSSATADIGSRGARIETIKARAATSVLELTTALSELEDTDIAEALISVKANENAYTAALSAAAQVLPPSLVDFMR